MLSKIIISPDQKTQIEQVDKLLTKLKMDKNHPDLLWMGGDSKSWGVEDAKKIRGHFLLKGDGGKVVVLTEADKLTIEAQNALLKLLEETPGDGMLILTTTNESNLSPTILSRCELIYGSGINNQQLWKKHQDQLDNFISSNLQNRFILIEKMEDKKEFLDILTEYVSNQLTHNPSLINLAQATLEGQKFANSNGNIRAILEYIALSF